MADASGQLNVSLLQDPVFGKDYISFVLDGQFQGGDSEKASFPRLPLYISSSETPAVQTQIFVSEKSMNSAMQSMHEAGSLVVGQKVESTYLKTIIPNFEEVFGKHGDVRMLLESSTAPSITISEGVSEVKAAATIRILNPFNESYEVMMMHCQVSSQVEFELLKDFRLIGNIKEMVMEVTAMEAYFQTSVTKEGVNKQIDSLAAPLQTLVNTVLSSGQGLPIPGSLKNELSHTRMFSYDHFLMVESDPQIQDRVKQRII